MRDVAEGRDEGAAGACACAWAAAWACGPWRQGRVIGRVSDAAAAAAAVRGVDGATLQATPICSGEAQSLMRRGNGEVPGDDEEIEPVEKAGGRG